MRLHDFLHEVRHALLRDRLRTGLTVAGIAVGAFAVAALLSLGAAIKGAIASSMTGLGENLVIVTPERGKGGALAGAAVAASELLESDARDLRRLDAVRQVATVVTTRLVAAVAQDSVSTLCVGADADYLAVANVELDDGDGWGDDPGAALRPVAILGATVARALFPDGDAVGRPLDLAGHRVLVVAVARERGHAAGGADEDDFVLVPKAFARQQLVARATPQAVDAIFVLAAPGQVDDAIDEAQDSFRRSRGMADLHDAISVNSLRGLMAASLQASDLLTLLMGGMAAVSVLVGGVGIVNVMLANIADRRLEIGLKLALGAPPWAIAAEFLAAAVLLAFGGALAGLAGAQVLAWLLASSNVLTVSLTASAVALSTGLALVVGVAAGVYPAGRAARLQPREILRDA
jgi:putative ABC transport system permease protein